MAQLILMRHGQSEWNKKNIFTGWVDIPLSKEGVDEALKAGEQIRDIPIDVIFTSTLVRGMMSAFLAMNEYSLDKIPVLVHAEGCIENKWGKCYSEEEKEKLIPVIQAWELNERMYGSLQGLNKQAMREHYGDDQIKLWRRSFDSAPPNGESLKMTAERTLPFFRSTILPYLELQKNVFIVAHGNSLRSIVMDLEKLNSEQILHLEIPTGKPLFYEYKAGSFLKRGDES